MSPSIPRTSERLAGTPAARRGGHWWLVAPTGSLLATDAAFTSELDLLAADLAAANQAVAEVLAPHAAQYRARR
ncbi:hypothetical protein [Streptomyces hygroscopicus]|uniref:hypothetical protein n=1 Tax=Streptomyces hygroscopicus TaxID=1912 RepID=UPI00099EBD80|nr:hypothetical protein [Streptomyces hygroscopicus]